jgi:hypothetical protein
VQNWVEILNYSRLAFDARLWKWLASSSSLYGKALGSSQENSHHRLWKWLASSPPIYRTVLEQFSGKQSSPFMEMVSKQSSNL